MDGRVGESLTAERWVVQERSEAAKRIVLAEAGPARGGAAPLSVAMGFLQRPGKDTTGPQA
ncbi:hypothetical protein VTN77DRAFT_6348 [Rasamsonia byssochlamydoides]|uniref:uncharacterized protein n=1 Tax=Rasamsonia byssochlamydoides TaxID=89139 RepID=UPI0037424C07